jgi:transposase
MWLTGRLTPDFKTIADFRRENGAAIRKVCRQFVVLCRDLKLFTQAVVAIESPRVPWRPVGLSQATTVAA